MSRTVQLDRRTLRHANSRIAEWKARRIAAQAAREITPSPFRLTSRSSACARLVGVKRVSVVGNSGSGKSYLAARIADKLGVPYVELDAIHHLPEWEPIDPYEFVAQVSAITATEGWVIDGNYRTVVVDGPVWERADTVVWLDLPRRTVMSQVTRRTLLRIVRREQLWNGNRERLRTLWSWNPEQSVVRWSWTQHANYAERYRTAMASPRFGHLEFVQLRSRAAAERWITTLDQTNTA